MSEIVDSAKRSPPKLVFIIPYRDRPLQLDFFKRHMKYILEDYDENDYQVFFIHQKDSRSFNRGAMKNIGFLVVKDLYPEDYKNITLVFNDLDTLPYVKNFLDYDTTHGVVKHFYGVTQTLGGIFTIKANDYERIHGFPNFWSWGYEDNMIYNRAKLMRLTIDRTVFYPMNDGNIIHLSNGTFREINKSEFDRYANNTKEGWSSIRDLHYEIEDNMVHIHRFHTDNEENMQLRKTHDLRKGATPFPYIKSRQNATMSLNMM
tara:strand:- start:1090 stop:1872 length:783 start_codon:yes stop_codon:yes gene_type:complete